ncbi:MAG TPA: hypothetical protein DCY54_05760 [Parachlamydiales bacterium]|nr:MAG: hypothetical protein A3E26_06070 [Chlamydiae bacterium RIFCSPHIGHO2_12_FULL_49_32]HAZ16119.1 hypothetical protein [Parachlamydiales bacterium]HCJ82883.1 hypothetical protein [Parachlamydiales bacterium]
MSQTAKHLEWQSHLEAQRASGLPAKRWCQQNHIHPSTFQYWKDKLSPQALGKASFTELSLNCSDTISLQTRGVHIRIRADCNQKLRKQLFNLFAELP